MTSFFFLRCYYHPQVGDVCMCDDEVDDDSVYVCVCSFKV